MTCPDCERHKLSAALWRHKAYELNGTPLPWSAEEMIKEAVLAERERLRNSLRHSLVSGMETVRARVIMDGEEVSMLTLRVDEVCEAAAIRARGEKK